MTNKCSDLELCRELWDRGLRLETLLSHEKHVNGDMEVVMSRSWEKQLDPDSVHCQGSWEFLYPAPDTDELLAVMPYKINYSGKCSWKYPQGRAERAYFDFRKRADDFEVHYRPLIKIQELKPSNALARCLIWLIDKGYVKVVDGKISTN